MFTRPTPRGTALLYEDTMRQEKGRHPSQDWGQRKIPVSEPGVRWSLVIPQSIGPPVASVVWKITACMASVMEERA